MHERMSGKDFDLLTKVFTHMSGSERGAFADSPEYKTAITLMRIRYYDQAVDLVRKFQTESGDVYRARAAACGLYDNDNFVQELDS